MANIVRSRLFIAPGGLNAMDGFHKSLVSNDAEAVLANTPFLLSRCSSDLRYLFVSEAYARMLGRTPRAMVGKKIKEVMGELRFHTIRPHIEAVLSGQQVEYENRVHFQGVGARLLHVIYTPDRDDLGRVRGWVASIVDITETRESQERIAADLHATELLRAVAAECVRDDADFDCCLEEVLNAAIDIAGAEKGTLQLLDPLSNLRIVAQRGFGRAFLDFFNSVQAGEAAACAAALKSGSAVIVPDISASPIFAGQASLEILAGEGVRAVVSIPLGSGRGGLLGMVSTHFLEPHEPQSRNLRYLDLLARIAGDYLQRRQAEQTERMLLDEVQHRSNNLLAVVQALARGSLAEKDHEAFELRLRALARSNHRITRSQTGQMLVLDSVSGQLEAFADRVVMHGPDIMVSVQQAQSIGLALHELVTNAVKHGALSNASGTIAISWERQPGARLRLAWKEQGGPSVAKPVRTGFGTKVLTAAFPNAEVDYAPDGLRCQFELQLGT